jgi:riboflavin synthase
MAGMFTGLVETIGSIDSVRPEGAGVRLRVRAGELAADASLGDSIALNGCCLTVVERNGEVLGFDAGSETLSRTNLGKLVSGSRLNLERSLKVGDRLGGHYVSGHIDALGTLDQVRREGAWACYWFRVPGELSRQMARKASIAVDGVSLTLVDVEPGRFSVALIPHTLENTTLGKLIPGDTVNIETDILAKYVEQQLQFKHEIRNPKSET